MNPGKQQTLTEPGHIPQQHVVLGAGGAAGQAVVRELVRLGLPVDAVARKPLSLPTGARLVTGDLRDPEAVRRLTRGAEVVYMAAQPAYTRWPQEFPSLLRSVLDGVKGSNLHLVMVDNLYTYGPVEGPLTERSPERPASKKGKVRLELARTLLDAHGQGQVQVSIARFGDFYGPGVQGSVVGADFFQRILQGKPIQALGRIDQPHTFSFIDDLGRALVLLGQNLPAAGRVWHVPAAPPLTVQELASLTARLAGVQLRRPQVLPPLAVRALGTFVPILKEMHDVLYQFQQPFVSEGHPFAVRYGFQATSHEQAVQLTLQGLQQGHPATVFQP